MVENALSQRRLNTIKLVILWLVPLGLMVLAGVFYYLAQSGKVVLGSKNKGVLIRPPIQLKEVFNNVPALTVNHSGESIWDNKWSIVLIGDRQCDQPCREALYLSRQLHIRLDKEAHRVQRLYLFDDANGDGTSVELADFLQQEHRLLNPVGISPGVLNQLRERIAITEAPMQFFLVDPDAWAMMVYSIDHSGNEVLADLKHLLKYSKKR